MHTPAGARAADGGDAGGSQQPAGIRLSLIAASGPADELAPDLAADLPALPGERASEGVSCLVPVVVDGLAREAGTETTEMIDAAREAHAAGGLRSGRLRHGRVAADRAASVIAGASPMHGVGVLCCRRSARCTCAVARATPSCASSTGSWARAPRDAATTSGC